MHCWLEWNGLARELGGDAGCPVFSIPYVMNYTLRHTSQFQTRTACHLRAALARLQTVR